MSRRPIDKATKNAARRKYATGSWKLLARFLVGAGELDADPFDEATAKILAAGERHFCIRPSSKATIEHRQHAIFNAIEAVRASELGEEAAGEARPNPLPFSHRQFYSSLAWKRLRYRVLQERGLKCECCGATKDDARLVMNVDHIKPIKTHWNLRLEMDNLQVLCSDCNRGKGSADQTDWRETNSKIG